MSIISLQVKRINNFIKAGKNFFGINKKHSMKVTSVDKDLDISKKKIK